jgi:hypothetical protein
MVVILIGVGVGRASEAAADTSFYTATNEYAGTLFSVEAELLWAMGSLTWQTGHIHTDRHHGLRHLDHCRLCFRPFLWNARPEQAECS